MNNLGLKHNAVYISISTEAEMDSASTYANRVPLCS